jgi:UMF1 family MFS transporter
VANVGAEDGAVNVAKRVSVLSILSWALYDLANTMFSFTISALYLPLWVVNDMGGRDSDYGLASSFSMALVFLTAPFLGALSDQARGRKPFLIVTTLVCIAFMAVLGQGGVTTTLIFFVIANYFYQAGVIFYDALLPAVSTPENRGKVGGIGVGIGAIGAFIGVGSGALILARDISNKPLVFQVAALLFLLFALPCFLFVKEPRRAIARPFGLASAQAALRELRQTAKRVNRYPGLGRFLIGRIFYSDAANTLVAFVGIYVTLEVGFSQQWTQFLLISILAFSLIGGIFWGRVVDRIGPKRTLNYILSIWVVVLTFTAAIGQFDWPGVLTWIAGPIVGFCLAGTWAADRPYMLQLSPPRYLGQFYGLYAMVGRFAAIMGPLFWSLIVDGLGLGRPAAVLSLALMVLLAMLILRPVSDAPRAWQDEDLETPIAEEPGDGPGLAPAAT